MKYEMPNSLGEFEIPDELKYVIGPDGKDTLFVLFDSGNIYLYSLIWKKLCSEQRVTAQKVVEDQKLHWKRLNFLCIDIWHFCESKPVNCNAYSFSQIRLKIVFLF